MLVPSGSCPQAPALQHDDEICPATVGYPSMGMQCTHRLTAPWVTSSSMHGASLVRITALRLPCTLSSYRSCPGQQRCMQGAPTGDLWQHHDAADLLCTMTLYASYPAFIHQAAGSGNYGSGIWANLLPLAVRSPSSQHIFQETLPGRFKTPVKAP